MTNEKTAEKTRNVAVRIPVNAHKRLQIAKINGEHKAIGDMLLEAAAKGDPAMFADCVRTGAAAEADE
jgi:hypothetical protein